MKEKEQGKTSSDASDDIIYKVEVPANRYAANADARISTLTLLIRYDILCVEGLARALRIFKGRELPPRFHLTKPKTMQRMIVKAEVRLTRTLACLRLAQQPPGL